MRRTGCFAIPRGLREAEQQKGVSDGRLHRVQDGEEGRVGEHGDKCDLRDALPKEEEQEQRRRAENREEECSAARQPPFCAQRRVRGAPARGGGQDDGG